MNSKDVADAIDTTPRILRQFLRSGHSTFVAVGSGARYDFKETDIPTLRKRFSEWQSKGKPRPKPNRPQTNGRVVRRMPALDAQRERDVAVWAEEDAARNGEPLVLPDIRDPRIRARVKAEEQAREERLIMLLMSKGMHVSQWGDRR